MKHVKSIESLDEMAKAYPAGSYVKVTSYRNLGIKQGSWRNYTIAPEIGAGAGDSGYFYIKIENSGRLWLEGKMFFPNSLRNGEAGIRGASIYSDVRCQVSGAEKPGPEFKYFQDNLKELEKIANEKIPLDGDEDFLMDASGKSIAVSSGQYSIFGFNYALTLEMKEPVLYIKKGQEYAYVKMSDLAGVDKEDSPESKKTIANWFTRNLKVEVDYMEDRDKYYIGTYKITGRGFSAGPFLSKDAADNALKVIEKSVDDEYSTMLSNSTSPLAVVKNSPGYGDWKTLDDMIELAKSVGVKVSLRELLSKKKGETGARKLGLLD
jgi:hypothetical protein